MLICFRDIDFSEIWIKVQQLLFKFGNIVCKMTAIFFRSQYFTWVSLSRVPIHPSHHRWAQLADHPFPKSLRMCSSTQAGSWKPHNQMWRSKCKRTLRDYMLGACVPQGLQGFLGNQRNVDARDQKNLKRTWKSAIGVVSMLFSKLFYPPPTHTYPPDHNVYHARTHLREKGIFFAKSRKRGYFAGTSPRNFEKG